MLPIRPNEISVSVNLVLKHKVASIRTRAKLDTEWFSRTEDWIPDSQTRRLFVYLNSGSVGIDPNDLFLCSESSDDEDSGKKDCAPPTNSSCPTRTSSYIAHPVMFSAMTTGPETPYTWPKRDSRSSSRIFGRYLFAFGSAPAMMDNAKDDGCLPDVWPAKYWPRTRDDRGLSTRLNYLIWSGYKHPSCPSRVVTD